MVQNRLDAKSAVGPWSIERQNQYCHVSCGSQFAREVRMPVESVLEIARVPQTEMPGPSVVDRIETGDVKHMSSVQAQSLALRL